MTAPTEHRQEPDSAPAREKPEIRPDYVGFWRLTEMEQVQRVRKGFPAGWAKAVLRRLDPRPDRLLLALRISPHSLGRKARDGERLSSDETERLLDLLRLIGQVETMVQESGDPEGFDAAAWLIDWMEEAVPALGWVTPLSLMDTAPGRRLVSRTLLQMQSGVYA